MENKKPPPPPSLYDTMIEKLKAAAFPVLLGIVIWLGQSMLSEIRQVVTGQTNIVINLTALTEQMKALDHRVSALERSSSGDK